MNLELGPVVGQTGGGLEVVEQQFSEKRSLDATVTLPEGWESAWVIAQVISDTSNINSGGYIFGWRTPMSTPDGYHRVALLRQGETASISVAAGTIAAIATADITMIRID